MATKSVFLIAASAGLMTLAKGSESLEFENISSSSTEVVDSRLN